MDYAFINGTGEGQPLGIINDPALMEKVAVNWETATNPARLVKEGDTISIRGKGRVVVEKVGNTTKKDRIHILLKKFI